MSIGIAIFLILFIIAAIAIEIIAIVIMTGAIVTIMDFAEKIKERKRNRSEKKK
jgi:hypothetical protein